MFDGRRCSISEEPISVHFNDTRWESASPLKVLLQNTEREQHRSLLLDFVVTDHLPYCRRPREFDHNETIARMATEQMVADPFSIRSLLTLPALDNDDSSLWCLSPSEKSLTSTTFALDIPEEVKLQALQTGLFTLNLDDVALPDLDSTTDSAVATDTESHGSRPDGVRADLEGLDDIWAFPDIIDGSRKDALLSWDTFADKGCAEFMPAYLSEADTRYFGQALHPFNKQNDRILLKHAEPGFLLASLRELSLGRESAFFGYDPAKGIFSKRFDAYTLQDVSDDMMRAVVGDFLRLGNDMRMMRLFVMKGPVSSRKQVHVALCAAIDTAIYALENAVRDASETATSLMQMQNIIRKPGVIIACLRTLAEHCPKSTEDIGRFLRTCDMWSEKYPWLRESLQEISVRSLSSQIEAIGHSVGLGSTTMSSSTLPNYVSTGKLLNAEVTKVLVESQQALVLLRDVCPNHQLLACTPTLKAKLQWDFSWEAIAKLQTEATEYEASLKRAILDHRTPENSPPDIYPEQSTFSLEPGSLNLSAATVLQTVLGNEVTGAQDPLYRNISSALSNTKPAPYFDLQPDLDQSMSLSLMPLVTAQHRLLSYSILSLLFETHELRTHLLVQRRFQLLGNGLFASRLVYALFDSSEASGEGSRRKGGRTGLRLQSRDTWPPASSELRLVLMGILSESISSENRKRRQLKLATGSSGALQESLSFTIRALSDEDLEKCRNADSIHALDFLALQYKPTTPLLEAIITSRSLKQYDDIFVHLVRLLRVRSVSQELVRDVTTRARAGYPGVSQDHRARLELHHFISTLADWTQNTVIEQKWAAFAVTLHRVDESLRKCDYERVLAVGKGLSFLRSLHEGVVEDIASTLFVERRYTEVRTVLDHIFDIVLQLAKQIRIGESADGEISNDDSIRRLHENFREEVRSFLMYLRFDSSGSQGERNFKGPEPLMENLAVRLDMFGYYTGAT